MDGHEAERMGAETKRWTAWHRLWHWISAVAVLGLLLTVLLRKTFLSYKTNAVTIRDSLGAAGVEISKDLAKSIGRALRAPM